MPYVKDMWSEYEDHWWPTPLETGKRVSVSPRGSS